MLPPRIPWTTSEAFDPDWFEQVDTAPDDPYAANDSWTDEDSNFWDQMIFPL